MDAKEIRQSVLFALNRATNKKYVFGAVSNRHVHLCQEDIETLFGKGYELTIAKPLSQPDQYAAKETVTLIGKKGQIENIRVLGPKRPETQVEISITDSFKLGIPQDIRMSGDIKGSPGGILKTQNGSVTLKEGVIVSARHLHISEEQAADYGLFDGQRISLQTLGERSVVFNNVLVRSGKGHDLEVHLDMDEANAAGFKNGDVLELV